MTARASLSRRMNRAVSSTEMRRIEDRGVENGISRLMMMENAGSSIAREVARLYLEKKIRRKRVRVGLVAGTGNNGGDVFVAARHLAFWRKEFDLIVVLIGSEEDIRAEEAKTNWSILKKISSIKKFVVDSPSALPRLKRAISNCEAIVVGIFGTGFKGKPRELQRRAIAIINQNDSARKISVDLPSGMDADSGECQFAVDSDMTVTMHMPKVGMLASPIARQKCKEIVVANIGLPS